MAEIIRRLCIKRMCRDPE